MLTGAEGAGSSAPPEEEPTGRSVGSGEPSIPATGSGDRGSWPGTGDPRVDAAVARLAELDRLPVGEHAPVYSDAHDLLRAVLDDADQRPATDPEPGEPAR